MEGRSIVKGTLYLLLTVIGIPGNLTIITSFIHIAYYDFKLLPADTIVSNLASVNLRVVLARCIPETTAAFGLKQLFDDHGCKIVIFIYRTTRSLSIWLTFLLSSFQCITLAPVTSTWSTVKRQAANYLGAVLVFLWLLNMSLSTPAILFSISSENNSTGIKHAVNLEYCFVKFPSHTVKLANGALQTSRDVIPIVLMVLASVYILLVLYRHRQQVKGIRSSSKKQGSTVETRAAKAVVTLVTLYVLCILWIYTLTVTKTMQTSLISDLRVFFSLLYASVIVIIVSNRKVHNKLKCAKANRKQCCQKLTTAMWLTLSYLLRWSSKPLSSWATNAGLTCDIHISERIKKNIAQIGKALKSVMHSALQKFN
ncbi:olfactory receptor class A-like protein 1 [Carcharodon carcharias]|uniref:olfactory receptor class A-like protein 1 n=1 Tax=Carcharodon carcharias TaxID=13397 RepID=UPI001B7F5849|nr:olfactory receptor class A-like protein 1 [Carcharodon carcharias]